LPIIPMSSGEIIDPAPSQSRLPVSSSPRKSTDIRRSLPAAAKTLTFGPSLSSTLASAPKQDGDATAPRSTPTKPPPAPTQKPVSSTVERPEHVRDSASELPRIDIEEDEDVEPTRVGSFRRAIQPVVNTIVFDEGADREPSGERGPPT